MPFSVACSALGGGENIEEVKARMLGGAGQGHSTPEWRKSLSFGNGMISAVCSQMNGGG